MVPPLGGSECLDTRGEGTLPRGVIAAHCYDHSGSLWRFKLRPQLPGGGVLLKIGKEYPPRRACQNGVGEDAVRGRPWEVDGDAVISGIVIDMRDLCRIDPGHGIKLQHGAPL